MQDAPEIKDVLVAVERMEKDVRLCFDGVHDRFGLFDERFKQLGKEITSLQEACVTREYLDHQLLDVRADMHTMIRKGDLKVDTLVDILRVKDVISASEKTRLRAMSPFPRQ